MKGCLLLSQIEWGGLILSQILHLNEEDKMNGLKARGFLSVYICDLILIFSKQGSLHIKLYYSSSK